MRVVSIILFVLSSCASSETVRCGDLTCASGSRCSADNQCIPPDCGDGTIGQTEECDPMATALRCIDFEYYGVQPVGCTETCKLDFEGCFGTCGDHSVNGPESCDGIPQAGLACSDFGFDVGRLACSSACSPSFELCSSIGWQQAAGGATNELNAVWAAEILSGTNGDKTLVGFAVGNGGTILRFIDGVWASMPSPTSANLYSVAGTAQGVIAVGAGGVVLTLQFATGTWSMTTVPVNGNGNLLAVAGTGPTNIVAVGDGGTILQFNGTTWTPQASGTNLSLRGVWVGPSEAFVVGDSGTVLRRNAGTWNVIPPATVFGNPATTPQLEDVFAIDGEVFIGGVAILVHFDGAWETLAFPPDVTAFVGLSVWGTSKNDIYFAGSSGQILHWDGLVLVKQPTNTTRSITQVYGVDASRVIAATRSGELLELNGLVLRSEDPGSSEELRGAYMDGDFTYVVGQAGTVLRHDRATWSVVPWTLTPAVNNTVWATGSSPTGGEIFVTASLPGGIYHKSGTADFVRVTTTAMFGIWGLTTPVLKVVGVGSATSLFDGQIHEYTVATGWTTATIPASTPRLVGVWASSDGHWFAVGDAGTALHKTPTGAWAKVATPPGTGDLSSVWGTSANDVFAVGVLGTIIHWDGTAWRTMYSGTANGLLAVAGTTGSDVYAVGNNGLVLHFDGTSWSRMTPLGIEVSAVWSDGARTVFAGSKAGIGSLYWLTRTIESKENRCQDPWDNNGKDGTNCDDPDCATSLTCARGGVCETVERITCDTRDAQLSTYTGIARVDDLPCLDHSTPGPEASLRFVPDFTGTVTLTMTEPTDVLDLVVIDAALGACQLDTCRPATRGSGTQTITFDVTADRTYYVFVDGPVYTAADFTLTVTCPPPD